MSNSQAVRLLREKIARLEQRLYANTAAALSTGKRFNLSMQLGIARVLYAQRMGIKGWSADAALATNEED